MMEQNGKPERVAVYCRVSSEEQAESGTIENQIEFARKFCELHSLQALETYADEGVSGATDPTHRPAAARMLADAKAGRFNVLLVYRIDRLARSLWHLLNIYQQLEDWGVAVRSMTEPLDTSSPVGRFVFQLLGSIAELERETIRQRTELGRERAIANGKALGKRPMGLALNDSGQLAVHPQEGPLVQEMFTLAADGLSAGAIARILDQRGTPTMWTARGYRQGERTGLWTQQAVLTVLHNPVYWTGEWRYSHKDGTKSAVPAPMLIDIAMATRAHRQLSLNNLKAKGVHRPYLLSGLIRCGDCGSACVGSSNGADTGRRYYSCHAAQNRKRYPNKNCTMPKVRADLLDAEVWADIKAVADDPGELAQRIQARLLQSAGGVEAKRKQLVEVVAEYDAITNSRLDAQLRADRGEMTRDELGKYLRATVGRVGELERLKIELSEQLADLQVDEAKVASLEEICRNLRELVAQAEGHPELQRKVIASLTKQVAIRRGRDGKAEVEIEYMVSSLGKRGAGSDGSTSTASTPCRW